MCELCNRLRERDANPKPRDIVCPFCYSVNEYNPRCPECMGVKATMQQFDKMFPPIES